MKNLTVDDPELSYLVTQEQERLESTLNLIAAESHAPKSIQEILGSVFNTKTIEGYPGKRFHAGCIWVDEVEKLAVDRCKQLFGADHANVQPHSGSSANIAAYFAVLNLKDRVLSMSLPHGGHLSHGHPASITHRCYEFSHYGVDPKTEQIDYDEVERLACQVKPALIVAGASSYPRLIDYRKMKTIARKVSALFMVDMAHFAGLVAAKVIPSPLPHADIVTFTTYKTMMGGRGGVILCSESLSGKIDKAVFPGCQGTSPVNSIAAKALIFKLAMGDDFVKVQKRTLKNAKSLCSCLAQKGFRLVSGGTDNHQVLLDLSGKKISGRSAEKALESAGIIANANVVPEDSLHPGRVSGLRLGTSAVSARGMQEDEMSRIADLIETVLKSPQNDDCTADVKARVAHLCIAFPIPLSL